MGGPHSCFRSASAAHEPAASFMQWRRSVPTRGCAARPRRRLARRNRNFSVRVGPANEIVRDESLATEGRIGQLWRAAVAPVSDTVTNLSRRQTFGTGTVTRAALPFARPPADLVRADRWMLANGESTRELPIYLDGWDYHTHLRLRRTLGVETARLRERSGLGADAPLALVVSVFSTTTWLRTRTFHHPLGAGDEEEILVEFDLPGEELGGNVRLRTAIILDSGANGEGPFVAHLPGVCSGTTAKRCASKATLPSFRSL